MDLADAVGVAAEGDAVGRRAENGHDTGAGEKARVIGLRQINAVP